MKIKRIHHTNGSESFATQGVVILKNKETKEDIIVTEIDAQNFEEAVENLKDGEHHG